MGFSLGFGSSKSKSSSTNKIDEALVPIQGEILDQAMNMATTPLQQYQGQRVASTNPLQTQSYSALGSLGTQGQGLAQQGFNILGNIGTAADRMSAYQNPFTSEVIDRSLADLERNRQITGTNDAASAVAANAFGGSRQGVQNALTNEAYAKQAGDMASQLRYQGFNTALGAAQSDVAQQQSLAQALQGAGYGALQGSLDAGQLQQAQQQAQLDSDREKFYEPQNQQMQLLDFLTGIASGVPQGGSSTGSTKSGGFSIGLSGG